MPNCVAPFAGAWIEINAHVYHLLHFVSLPSRERGLKLSYLLSIKKIDQSLPSRERGLKSLVIPSSLETIVRRSLRGSVD